MKERTYELTNYCPHHCKYCSSNAVSDFDKSTMLPFETILRDLRENGPFDRITLSGGEPLAHPQFYQILRLCEADAEDVLVFSNAIRHIAFNANVIDGIYVEANITLPAGIDRLHVLKRIVQGREAKRPEVQLSSNYEHGKDCKCHHVVIRPDGSQGRPCKKEG